MNILVVYTPKKTDESLATAILYTLPKERYQVNTMPIIPEEIISNLDTLRQSVEDEEIDLVIAAEFNAFQVLALPPKVKKLVICPIIDPLEAPELQLSSRVIVDDYNYMLQLRTVVCEHVNMARKRNTFAIFIPCYDMPKQHEIFESKYGNEENKNWIDYTGRKAEGKLYKITKDGKFVINREEAGENKWSDYNDVIDEHLLKVLSSYFQM